MHQKQPLAQWGIGMILLFISAVKIYINKSKVIHEQMHINSLSGGL